MSFNEEDRVDAELRGDGWRSLAPPQTVRCYVASTWIDASVTEVNDETRDVRIEYPVVTRGYDISSSTSHNTDLRKGCSDVINSFPANQDWSRHPQ